MSQATPVLPTVGEIARQLDEPLHRVEYVIRSRGIRAESRAGNCRVFSETAVNRIDSEIRRIDAEKGSEISEQ